jgi:hypothetical protein
MGCTVYIHGIWALKLCQCHIHGCAVILVMHNESYISVTN